MTPGCGRRKGKAVIVKSEWITHKNVRIFHLRLDHFGDDSAELQKEVDACHEVVMRQPLDSVLELVDVTGTTGSMKNVDIFRTAVGESRPHTRRMAVIGITGVRHIIAHAVTRVTGIEYTPFDDFEKAKDWLSENR